MAMHNSDTTQLLGSRNIAFAAGRGLLEMRLVISDVESFVLEYLYFDNPDPWLALALVLGPSFFPFSRTPPNLGAGCTATEISGRIAYCTLPLFIFLIPRYPFKCYFLCEFHISFYKLLISNSHTLHLNIPFE
jgi:hypothetical protein